MALKGFFQVRFINYQLRRWRRAATKIRTRASTEGNDLPRRMAFEFIDLIRDNIQTGKYDASYPEYNERYADWKYNVYGSQGGFWFLRGDLYRSLAVFKDEGGWMAGVPSGIMDYGMKSWFGANVARRQMPIALYARWMEFGRAGQPERPLFQPTTVEYWHGGMRDKAAESLGFIRGEWR